MIKGKSRKIKHLNNEKVHLWLLGHGPEDLKVGCIPISSVWRNLYWGCGCDHGYAVQPQCVVWVCLWDKQFHVLFPDFIKPFFVWNFFILLQTLLLWETEQENTLLKIKMTGSSENIKPVVRCPCMWPGTDAAVTYRLWQNRALGIAPAASTLNHNCPRSARVATRKWSHPNSLGLDQDKHLQCCVPLTPGDCMGTAVCRPYNASGSSAPLSPCPT